MRADGDPPKPLSDVLESLDLSSPAFAHAVLDAAPVIVVVLDADGRILHYNRFLEQLSGRPLAELRGCDWFTEFLLADERDSVRVAFQRAWADGPPSGDNIKHIRVRDGAPRTIEWHSSKLQREDGTLSALVAVGVDITDRVREAREATELALRFELFANHIDEAFFMMDATRTRILYLSPAFERIFGIARQTFYDDAWGAAAQLIHPDDADRLKQVMATRNDHALGSIVEHEYRILRPVPGREGERELRWLWNRSTTVELHDGQAPQVIGTIVDITERKQATQELEQLGRTFALLEGAIDEMFVLVSPDRTRVLYATESIERVFGLNREAVYADLAVMLAVIHPDDRERMADSLTDAIPTGGTSHEFRAFVADGGLRWISTRVRKLGPNSPMPGAVVAVSIDITAQRESEEALRELTEVLEARVEQRTRSLMVERQRLQQIIDGMDVFVGILDPAGMLLQVNAAASEIARGIIGHRLDAVPGLELTPESLTDVRVGLDRAQRGLPVRFDLDNRARGGHSSVTDTSLSPIFDAEGKVIEIVWTGVDVTERREIERRLRDSLAALETKQARLSDAQRIAEVGDWEWDISTGVLTWSDQVYRIFGVTREQVVPTYAYFLSMVHPDDRQQVADAVEQSVLTGNRYEVEHRIIRPDGEIRTVVENAELLCDANGDPARMRGTVQDNTRQKQVEAVLRTSLADKDALLHEIHHRVKNNLQVVASLLYLQGSNATPAIRTVLDECRARIRSMALIHEHLYLSHQLARIEMYDFVLTLAEELSRMFADGRPMEVHVSGGGLWLDIERAVPVALIANELLTNALKYAYPAPHHGSHCEIRIEIGNDRIEISDDGPGLPTGLDESETSSLGLRLVRTLVRQLDARLEINNDSGARFCLLLFPSPREPGPPKPLY